MEFDDQLHRFFGTIDLSGLGSDALSAGIDRMQVELGLETDRGRRFALWSILYMLKSAPDIDVAFKDPSDQDAARAFMELLDQPE